MDPQNRRFFEPPQQRAQLPALPSLEHLKKQARDLLTAYRHGDPDAAQRLRRWFPQQPQQPGPEQRFKLNQAQLAIAREHGFASWPQLRQAVLKALVEGLAVRHWPEWRRAAAARAALTQAGDAGLMAVLDGLSHPEPRVRRGAADFLDHHADDRCVPKLADLILHDPVPYVRWSALHALGCQRCKPSPLTADLTPLLVRVALEDPSPRVRWRAVGSLDTAQLVRVAGEDLSPRVRVRAPGRCAGQGNARAGAGRHPPPRPRRGAPGAPAPQS